MLGVDGLFYPISSVVVRAIDKPRSAWHTTRNTGNYFLS
jgi:hypothetical protein